jgi:zinc D-Ala-D-Ala dipeptidase
MTCISIRRKLGAAMLLSAVLTYGARAQTKSDFVDISTIPGVRIDLRYATTNNFVGTNVYGSFHTAYLHRKAADKLRKAAELLQQERPGWSLLVLDALRPRSVQRIFWAKVKGTPAQMYVADPDQGSIHNYGFAVDITLADANGKEVDMGTPHDSFDSLAQPQLEERYLAAGRLTHEQEANRLALRKAMTGAGFIQLPF